MTEHKNTIAGAALSFFPCPWKRLKRQHPSCDHLNILELLAVNAGGPDLVPRRRHATRRRIANGGQDDDLVVACKRVTVVYVIRPLASCGC